MTDTAADPRAGTREAIVEAAASLLRDGGFAAVTIRAAAETAGVQAPTIYRLFGDKDGLMEAVAEHVMAAFVEDKTEAMVMATGADADPLVDLRESWSRQIEFGLANPAIFRLLSDPKRATSSPAALRGKVVLESRVRRLAEAGILGVSEERAVTLIHAAGLGAIQYLISTPPADRDHALAEEMLEAVLARILVRKSSIARSGPAAAAVTLRALAPQLGALSEPERGLLTEWLDRIVAELEPPVGIEPTTYSLRVH